MSSSLMFYFPTGDINFETFCKICKKIQVTSEDDLMKAFKRIDLNGDGYISHAELKKVMTTVSQLLFNNCHMLMRRRVFICFLSAIFYLCSKISQERQLQFCYRIFYGIRIRPTLSP